MIVVIKMNETDWQDRLVNLLYTLFWLLIAFFIAYFVYGQDWNAALGFALWALIIYIASWLVIIPYGGVAFIWVIGAL